MREGLEFSLQWHKGDIGIRFNTDVDDYHAEIVRFQRDKSGEESCYMIAFLKEDDEGYNLETVGRRLTEAMNESELKADEISSAINHTMKALDELHFLVKV